MNLDLGYPYIRTYSGIDFRIDLPQTNLVEIIDIAHALSHLCRYGGHCDPFYSVAQHSIATSYLVSPENRLSALLHDSTEAYMVDLPRPIKNRYPQYSQDEHALYAIIAKKFNLPHIIHPEVKKADDEMIFKYEWNFYMLKQPIPELEWFYNRFFIPKSSEEIKVEFLNRFYELVLERKSLERNEQEIVK